jgi:tetratricopeptide (TPR) repeat protein
MKHSRTRISRFALTVAAAASMLSGRLAAQAPPAHQGHQSNAIPLHETILGAHAWPITTTSPKAQAYFNQGLRLMYAYAPAEARRSFEESRRADASCAMCWWGEAWSMGSYLNGAMDDDDAPLAHAAAKRARDLAGTAKPVERDLIAALSSRYTTKHPSTGRRGLDSAYANAMAGVYARHPDDLEVATLYADALMLLEPRRGLWPLSKPSIVRIHQVLEGVLARHIGHPGACHAYVHATETSSKVTDAQKCADLLTASIPGASHINHMPSHTYNRVGRWGDATRVNIIAWHSDQRAERGEGFAIYPAHNLHMLLFAASVDGQGAIAIQAAKDYARLVPDDGASFRALTLVRFGRFDEVLELTKSPVHPVHAGLWAFGRGLAHLRMGKPDSATAYLARVDSLALNTPDSVVFRRHQPARILGIVGNILRGELLRAQGRSDDAVRALQEAVKLEEGLQYDEPEPLPFSARDFLGALLLEAGRTAEAAKVYEAALIARPNNGWSLVGLERSLRLLRRAAEADAAKTRFEQAWARSEVLLTESRF